MNSLNGLATHAIQMNQYQCNHPMQVSTPLNLMDSLINRTGHIALANIQTCPEGHVIQTRALKGQEVQII